LIWVGGEHRPAHRYQTDRPPRGPPPTAPAADTTCRGTAIDEPSQDIDDSLQPEPGPAVDSIGQHRDRQVPLGYYGGLGNVAEKTAGAAKPVSVTQLAAHDAWSVVPLHGCVRIAPLRPNHFAPTRNRQKTAR
jgi:hypothetical protein